MILISLQIAAVLCLGVYLFYWRSGARRRNAQTWDSLLARLRPDWSARELSDQCSLKEGLNATPEDACCAWKVQSLWVMYQNARTMLEMADYAAKNSDTVDRLLLETLRSDAMQIRVCVLTALAHTDSPRPARVSASMPSARHHVHRYGCTHDPVASGKLPMMVPDFVAAM